MTQFLVRALVAMPALIGLFATQVQAQDSRLDQVSQYMLESQSMGQVTSVSQLRDVRPTDWAFQALQSLVERYGCIAGFPDGTFRGNRAMTRYEFAAGLNACLDRVNELIASATSDLVTQEDLAVLQRLQEEFQAELATLRGRVDALEARTAELEANQFSTTTKLSGVVTFNLGSAFDGEVNGVEVEDELTFGSSVYLTLNTSFTGKDLLTLDLLAANIESYGDRTGVPEAFLWAEDDTGNLFELNNLYYTFPIGKAQIYVGTVDLEPEEVAPTTGNLIDGATGFFFGSESPFLAYQLIDGGAGAGLNYQLTDAFNIAGGYIGATGEAGQAGDDFGLTGGDNTSFAQLTFTPGSKLVVAATYNHTYFSDGDGSGFIDVNGSPSFTVDSAGVNAGYHISPKINISGWANWAWANSQDDNSDATLFEWAAQLGFPDLFREGNYGAVSVGGFPYITDADGATFVEADDAPLLAQVFYRFQVTDNISVQPGVFYIANPAGNDDNDDIWIGAVDAFFSF